MSSKDQGSSTVNGDLITALNHPLRRAILRVFLSKGTKRSPAVLSPKELAEIIGAPLPNVSYHVRELVEPGGLKLVATEQVRGSVKHSYEPDGLAGEPLVREVLASMESEDELWMEQVKRERAHA